MVLGLDYATAARVWRELRQSDVPARIVNREFARYDVLLHAATDNDDLRRHLTERAGMPAASCRGCSPGCLSSFIAACATRRSSR